MQNRKTHQLIAFILAVGLILSCCVAVWIASDGGKRLGLGAGLAASETAAVFLPLTARASNATDIAFSITLDADTQIAGNTANTQIAETQVAEQQFLNDYGTLPNLHDPGAPYSPYIKGKIVVISQTNQNPKEFADDDFLFVGSTSLPAEWFAATPAEVGTVIWEKCTFDQVGMYTNGEPALLWHCDLTIIDRATATVVGRKHFDGEYPPGTIQGPAPNSCCGPPLDAMAQYIASLPRK